MSITTLREAVRQVRDCDFQCEAGPLDNNAGWQFLTHAIDYGPRFFLGQTVWYEVMATVSSFTLREWYPFIIIGCQMTSDTERRTWRYALSNDPPEPYHTGEISFANVPETALHPTKPEDAA